MTSGSFRASCTACRCAATGRYRPDNGERAIGTDTISLQWNNGTLASVLCRHEPISHKEGERMHSMRKVLGIAAGFSVLAVAACATPQYPQGMTFFITSVGTGNGADLGGIEGADRHCQSLAAKVGAGSRTWRAYLSSQGKTTSDTNVVHARDRIGTGPWHNSKGERIARDVADLHSPNNNINKETGLDEKGEKVNGRGDKPNKHDILTGSRLDGTAFASQTDMTCGNWTKSGD